MQVRCRAGLLSVGLVSNDVLTVFLCLVLRFFSCLSVLVKLLTANVVSERM